MAAFATPDDLATRMQRTFTEPEEAWVTALLVDAASIMRGVMRQQVYPSTTVEYVTYPVGGRVDLPQAFITSIDTVTQDGSELVLDTDYTRFEDSLIIGCDLPVTVELTYGLDTAPADLVAINCVMVSGAILTVEAGLGLTAGGLSSVALDDFKAAFADAGEQSGMVLSPFSQKYLVETYGRTGWVVNTR